MVEFIKKFKDKVPYDRKQYRDFFNDDTDPSIKWYGMSFQLPGGFEGNEVNFKEYLETYEPWFKQVVLKLDNGSSWIVSHEGKGLKWFPYGGDSLTHLRGLFKQNNVPNTFKGALIFSLNDLLAFSRDLISYPYAAASKVGALYRDLDISHGEFPVVIKISGHLNIDILSTDKEMLKELVRENSLSFFVLKAYNGTSLLEL